MQGDALSKREGKPHLAQVLESETYDFVLANPPFTGTVDSGDLEPDSVLFPRVGGGGKKKDDSITNKSELLFLWLMLDLLRVGGRCAVIIPKGCCSAIPMPTCVCAASSSPSMWLKV